MICCINKCLDCYHLILLFQTALFLAVREQKTEIVQLLLNYGADPNIQGKIHGIQDSYEFRSPLHLVAEMGDEAIQLLQILLDNENTNIDIRSESDSMELIYSIACCEVMLLPLHP